jgi:molybdopterin converting factor small subunit
MSVTIKLNSVFFEYTDDQEAIDVKGDTVRECLDNLILQFPAMKEQLFDVDGRLAALIIFQGDVILPNALDTPIQRHRELSVLPMIMGG